MMLRFGGVFFQNAFEENGVLYGKKVYLFGCTERKWLADFIYFSSFGSWLICLVVVFPLLFGLSSSYVDLSDCSSAGHV